MASPASERRVLDEERRLGRRLPAALRERLLAENGGDIETDHRYVDSPEDSRWQLRGVADTRTSSGRTWMAQGLAEGTAAEAAENVPWEVTPGTVVIADNGTGDLLLLSLDDRYEVRDHETGEVEPVGVRLRVGLGSFTDAAG